MFSFEFSVKIDDKTVAVNIEFTSVCEYEVEEVSYKIQREFPTQQREDFVRAIIEKYPMKEFKTLEPTDLLNSFARQLKSLYGSNKVHSYQTDLANDMFFGDTFLFISGFLKIQWKCDSYFSFIVLTNHYKSFLDIPIDVAAARRQERAKPRMRFC